MSTRFDTTPDHGKARFVVELIPVLAGKPGVSVSVAGHDEYLYLRCDDCEDHITGLDAGDSLDGLLRDVRIHMRIVHEEDS